LEELQTVELEIPADLKEESPGGFVLRYVSISAAPLRYEKREVRTIMDIDGEQNKNSSGAVITSSAPFQINLK
jgi:hypothetical protein